MDVREKLVELVDKARRYAANKCHSFMACAECDHYGEYDGNCRNTYIAESLIANGVTVQGWISVDDRLPKNFVSVLGYMTDAGEFPPVRECYTVGNAFFFPAFGDVHPVSHWCELPQPPKGE